MLLVDIGNTRIKWSVLRGEKLGRQKALDHAGLSARDLERHLFATRGITRVIAASVAGVRLNRLLAATCRRKTGLACEFVASARNAAGLTTRYKEPWRLGVDRFVGVIAGYHMARARGACVVDVGTAMTVDLVDPLGVHLGGAIMPGPQLMVGSVLKNTAGIARRASGAAQGKGMFALDTRAAIAQGARYAAAAVIDRAVTEAARMLQRTPLVLLTGGAAVQVEPLLHCSYVSVPDLVLRGVALRCGLSLK
ncbi:MAG TPA: type III pantothenate kinase [Steroidobacteraceae bacterium]|jgi:type III pantothenate kinase|nr:type III pantothenate kinase [Steroidobacteraceae bacterium]